MAYIGTQPKDIRSFGKAKFDFTATQGQTSFYGLDDDGKTLHFTAGQITVYLNGILLDESDYWFYDGMELNLNSPANAGDILSVVALQTDIPNSDYVPATGGTFSGAVVANDGLTINNNAATVLTVDRATSDGTIVDIKKDGTSVGSVGTSGGTLIVGNKADHSGVNFGYRNLFPMIGGSSNDGAVSIGSSTGRFKDLYLSGGVYLGGTGAANKLDDYEEGAWTPYVTNYTMGPNNKGWYVKIGRLCFVTATIEWSSGSGNEAYINGLPFVASTSSNGNYSADSISMFEIGGITPNASNDVFYGRVGATGMATSIQLLQVDYSAGVHTGVAPSWSSSGVIRCSFSYSTE